MKIAFDHQIFTQQSYGGVSRYFTEIAAELSRQQDVRIFSPLHQNYYLKYLSNSVCRGFNIASVSRHLPRVISATNRILNYIPMKRWRPDIIHETYYTSAPSGPKDCLRVTTVHDMTHELFPEYFNSNDQTAVLKKISINRADKIICISHNTKNDLINLLNTPPEKISVVYLGQRDLIKKPETPFVKREGRPYLLYVGNRKGYKNFHGFIRAFASSEKLKNDFNIIAFGGGAFNDAEKALFKELRLDSKKIIQINGSDRELSTAYLNARAFVYPSIYEGFGLPPLEAMNNQCPVFSSNSSSMPEVIGEAGIYFSPLDHDDMKSTMEENVYDDTLLRDLVKKGLDRTKLFSWQKCAQETQKVYQAAHTI